MSNAPAACRSFEPITPGDLTRLHRLALERFDWVSRDGNGSAPYRGRLELACFCQGAALHHHQCSAGHADRRGIHDLDVWGFFRLLPHGSFPPRWRGEADFGPSRFGSCACFGTTGRKVDVLGRAIEFREGETAIDAVLRWLAGRGSSPAELRRRPVYVISPGVDFGRCIWLPPELRAA